MTALTAKYTLFVDESGEAGIQKVRTDKSGGASPYMTLGAALVVNQDQGGIRLELEKIAEKFGKNDLHCANLKHAQKVYYTRSLKSVRFLAFGVISHKSTLGSYNQKISYESKRFYNKCAQYLLEKVGMFMEINKIAPDDVEIVFEEGNFDYSALISLISKCQENPIQPDTKFLGRINAFKIRKKPKSEEPLLQLADVIAHSLYKCVDKSAANFQIPEPRYLSELRIRFFSHPETGRIEGCGIKSVHDLKQLALDADIYAFMDSLKIEK